MPVATSFGVPVNVLSNHNRCIYIEDRVHHQNKASEDQLLSDLQEPGLQHDADVGNNLDVASEVAVESESQNVSPENTLESGEGEPVSNAVNSESASAVREEEVVQTVNICVEELKAAFPAKLSHFAEINKKIYAHVKYDKYYARLEMLELYGVYEKVTQRDLTAEIGENVRKLNVAKRRSRVWACPYCRSYFRQGDKYGITRHMNE
uniref:Uncharacterized protein n=1 Tax=Tetranychus urticae TaxID=32264 RepID=T1KA22_TETUR